jgi:hypothetical protein
MIQRILDAITIEGAATGIGYSIIATLIVRSLDNILKSSSKTKEKSTKWDLISIGESIGCVGAIATIIGFILIYILGTVDKVFTIDWLAKMFLICYGGFLLLLIIRSLLSAIKGQANLGNNMEGISLMITFTSIMIFLLFQFKMIFEIDSGLTLEEVNKANEGLIDYLIFLMKAIFISGGYLILSSLINLVLNRAKNRNS